MAFAGEIGWIGKPCPDHPDITLVTKAMRSAAGWFLGTQCVECAKTDPAPNSRETGYYPSREELIQNAFAGTLQWRDVSFTGARFDPLDWSRLDSVRK